MTQEERRLFLLAELKKERPQYADLPIPSDETGQKRLLRALFNVRPPLAASDAFLAIQDAYLREETRKKGVTDLAALHPVQPDLYLWQGDITTLKCDAIVNAANSRLLGCFCPNHGCIDNAIHTFSGIRLRLACAALMEKQGHDEPTGNAKLTPAFNLPCRFVLHTVGPIVRGRLTQKDCLALADCYRTCLTLADAHGLHSIAFCCISTGEFHFPHDKAAEIAVETVKNYKAETQSKLQVIFNVFKNEDYALYRALLG